MVVGHSELMGGAGEAQEGGGASGGSSDIGPSTSIPVDSGGNRWPRQETIALIEIRSDMDPIFKDASLKAPLWEQVSRKMGELGFQRSAKKCREKFENVYKYHKRTKDGRASKPEGKTYRFFDQLEALDNNPILNIRHLGNTHSQLPSSAAAAALPTSPTPVTLLPPPPRFQPEAYATIYHHHHNHNHTQQQEQQPSSHLQGLMLSDSTTMSSSSSSSSEEEMGGHGRRNGRSKSRRRKKKWKDYLEMMMRQVIEKQEERQKRLLENLEQREMDRIAEEEAWRQQEMARINREHDLLVRERSMAAVKDAAMIAFLEKITNESHQSHHQQQPVVDLEPPADGGFISRNEEENGSGGGGGGGGDSSASSSRWPKAEVEALINLRTSLDLKYHDGAPKGPLWEEISAAMAKMGYKRSSKRCKEKWENINKYYKKVKEINKKRPEDSKTCPYFHKLEALHQRKMAARNNNVSTSAIGMASTCSTSAAMNV